jgi:hypothetical protein
MGFCFSSLTATAFCSFLFWTQVVELKWVICPALITPIWWGRPGKTQLVRPVEPEELAALISMLVLVSFGGPWSSSFLIWLQAQHFTGTVLNLFHRRCEAFVNDTS